MASVIPGYEYDYLSTVTDDAVYFTVAKGEENVLVVFVQEKKQNKGTN